MNLIDMLNKTGKNTEEAFYIADVMLCSADMMVLNFLQ